MSSNVLILRKSRSSSTKKSLAHVKPAWNCVLWTSALRALTVSRPGCVPHKTSKLFLIMWSGGLTNLYPTTKDLPGNLCQVTLTICLLLTSQRPAPFFKKSRFLREVRRNKQMKFCQACHKSAKGLISTLKMFYMNLNLLNDSAWAHLGLFISNQTDSGPTPTSRRPTSTLSRIVSTSLSMLLASSLHALMTTS